MFFDDNWNEDPLSETKDVTVDMKTDFFYLTLVFHNSIVNKVTSIKNAVSIKITFLLHVTKLSFICLWT